MNPFEPCFLVFGSLVLVFLVWVQCGEVALLDMLNPFAIHPNQMWEAMYQYTKQFVQRKINFVLIP